MSADEGLVAVLRMHEWTCRAVQQRPILACSCGHDLIPATSSGVATLDDHRAHVAAKLSEAGYRHRDEVAGAREDGYDDGVAQERVSIAKEIGRLDDHQRLLWARGYVRAYHLTREPCPTCSGPTRETVGMVCQTCGTDYAALAAVAEHLGGEG